MFEITSPSALNTRMPAALVPLMWLYEMVPPTVSWPGWCASPIAPCVIWNSFSPPVSSGSVWPGDRFRPMFSNTLSVITMSVSSPRPSFCIAAWHVSRNTLSLIVTPSRGALCVRISTRDAP